MLNGRFYYCCRSYIPKMVTTISPLCSSYPVTVPFLPMRVRSELPSFISEQAPDCGRSYNISLSRLVIKEYTVSTFNIFYGGLGTQALCHEELKHHRIGPCGEEPKITLDIPSRGSSHQPAITRLVVSLQTIPALG